MMDFSQALQHLKARETLTRAGWNGKGMWIFIQLPTSLSKMTRPYIYMKTIDGGLVPWIASQSDLLANDWELSQELAQV